LGEQQQSQIQVCVCVTHEHVVGGRDCSEAKERANAWNDVGGGLVNRE